MCLNWFEDHCPVLVDRKGNFLKKAQVTWRNGFRATHQTQKRLTFSNVSDKWERENLKYKLLSNFCWNMDFIHCKVIRWSQAELEAFMKKFHHHASQRLDTACKAAVRKDCAPLVWKLTGTLAMTVLANAIDALLHCTSKFRNVSWTEWKFCAPAENETCELSINSCRQPTEDITPSFLSVFRKTELFLQAL